MAHNPGSQKRRRIVRKRVNDDLSLCYMDQRDTDSNTASIDSQSIGHEIESLSVSNSDNTNETIDHVFS